MHPDYWLFILQLVSPKDASTLGYEVGLFTRCSFKSLAPGDGPGNPNPSRVQDFSYEVSQICKHKTMFALEHFPKELLIDLMQKNPKTLDFICCRNCLKKDFISWQYCVSLIHCFFLSNLSLGVYSDLNSYCLTFRGKSHHAKVAKSTHNERHL